MYGSSTAVFDYDQHFGRCGKQQQGDVDHDDDNDDDDDAGRHFGVDDATSSCWGEDSEASALRRFSDSKRGEKMENSGNEITNRGEIMN